jgi:fibronectin type 3 domain-containing protein
VKRKHALHRGRVDRPWWRRWFVILLGLLVLSLGPVLAYAQGAGSDTVVVVWTAPGDDADVGTAQAYDLRFSETPITESSFPSATAVQGIRAPGPSGARQSVTVRGLVRGTVYYFAIRTVDDAGNWSGLSNIARVDWAPDTAAPAAPTGLRAARLDGGIRVQWSANSEPDLIGYRLYRAFQADGPYFRVNEADIQVTEYLDTFTPSGAPTIWYQVTAVDANGNESARSLSYSINLEDSAAPAAPSGLRAVLGDDEIRVSWTANGEVDLAGYRVYRAFQEAGPFMKVNADLVMVNEFVDNFTPSSTDVIWYQVTAVDALGNESARSQAVALTLVEKAAQIVVEEGYPNPSHGSEPVHIPVVLPSTGVKNAIVEVLDSGGRRVRRIELNDLAGGRQEIVWDGKNDAGRVVAPGVYRGWLIAGSMRQSIRVVRVP